MNMIKLLFVLGLLATQLTLKGQSINKLIQATEGIIPYPQEVKLNQGTYNLPKSLQLYSPEKEFAFATKYLDSILRSYPEQGTLLRQKSQGTDIQILRNDAIKQQEGYHLSINSKGIRLEASHPTGALYAVVTLSQLLESHYRQRLGNFEPLECIQINDYPRYALRGLMLDPARHFLPTQDVKAYIEQMLYFKFNTLQLHLTDDQGWRIEVKKHPRLTAVTQERKVISPWQGRQDKETELAMHGFYTQEELKDLITFANERGINIIPEIDIPGHTAALLAAYPNLRLKAQKDSVFLLGKTDNVMLSALSDSTYSILSDVFNELSELFPKGTYLHLGGDESAIERNWAKDGEHLALMQQLGYSSAEGLMNYFFNRIYNIVRPQGWRLMQWCELDNIRMPASKYLMDYPKDVALVSWRMGLTPKCIELSKQSGHQLLLAPGESAYLDYPQWSYDLPEHNNWGMPITSLEQSYNFDLHSGISAKDDKHIMGIMATLWAEAIPNISRAYYMTYPRALALAEVGWTAHQHRSWQRFKHSLPSILNSLERRGIPHRRPTELYRH